MIRLACALLSAVLFGLFSSTLAGATSQVEISTVTSYDYDNNEHAAATADTTSERGPPSTDDDNTGSGAVDLWSGGAWSRSETEAPAPTTTYTASVHPAHAAAASGTTERHVRVTSRKSRALSGASVAAKTAPITALRPVGSVVGHVDDVMADSRLLEGIHPAQLENIMRGTPGWELGVVGRGRSAGSGWTAR